MRVEEEPHRRALALHILKSGPPWPTGFRQFLLFAGKSLLENKLRAPALHGHRRGRPRPFEAEYIAAWVPPFGCTPPAGSSVIPHSRVTERDEATPLPTGED